MPHNSADVATTFDPDRVLHRVGEFTLRALPHGSYLVELPDGTGVRVDEALWVLAAFATPRTPREVAEEAAGRAASVSDWIRAMDAIRALAQLGVLRGPGEAAPRRAESGFAAESQHIQMLDDVTRTRAFIDAITAAVGPDDVVLDIGTGTGVLAMAAARAGARHTYAVEVSAMADVAEAGFAANGFADRITLLRGHSTSLTLPEPATVVVAEVIGDDLFDESILPTLADAARRLATPDARFIPCSLQPVLQPLRLPDQFLDKMRYGSGRAEQWEREYLLRFEWLQDPRHRPPLSRIERKPHHFAELRTGDAVELPAVRFPGSSRMYEAVAQWPAGTDANAVALGFRADLGSGHEVTNLPGRAPEASSWGVVVFAPIPGAGPDPELPAQLTVRWTGRDTQLQWSCGNDD